MLIGAKRNVTVGEKTCIYLPITKQQQAHSWLHLRPAKRPPGIPKVRKQLKEARTVLALFVKVTCYLFKARSRR